MSLISFKNFLNLEKEFGAHDYHPLPVVLEKGEGVFMWDVNGKKYYDFLSAYSAVNQGQLNQTIVDAVVKHLTEEKLPTVPRSIRHKYMSAFLLATTGITNMDRVIPKVAGVEAPELMFKISRRWFKDSVKSISPFIAWLVKVLILLFFSRLSPIDKLEISSRVSHDIIVLSKSITKKIFLFN